MKKILLAATAFFALSVGAASADAFSNNIENFGGEIIAAHNFSTGVNTVNVNVGAVYTIASIDTKLYAVTGYEVVSGTFSGVAIGATKNINENTYIDGSLSYLSGVTIATVTVGFSF